MNAHNQCIFDEYVTITIIWIGNGILVIIKTHRKLLRNIICQSDVPIQPNFCTLSCGKC